MPTQRARALVWLAHRAARHDHRSWRTATAVRGARVPGDHQLYPFKVDGAKRMAVLEADGNVLPGARRRHWARRTTCRSSSKLNWPSDKRHGKMYGLCHQGERREAAPGERYFHLAGESASTNVYERQAGTGAVLQVAGTQATRAFACQREQVCGRCAQRGHYHREWPGSRAVVHTMRRAPMKPSVETAVWHEPYRRMNSTTSLKMTQRDKLENIPTQRAQERCGTAQHERRGPTAIRRAS